VSVAPGAGPLEGLSIEVVAELLAVTREALSNIARHANARHASVTLDGMPGELRLEIADDGHGFATEGSTERGHHGLANMRARSEALGGRFDLDSGPAGTRIIIALPRPHATTNGDDE
jgi:two-component system NarL family sensor kinase